MGGFDLEASYLRVEGFEITADKPATAVQLRASHCEILDNYIHDMMAGVNGSVGQPSADGNTRDYSAVAHNRIAYNKVYHSEYGFILGGEDWLVENNEVEPPLHVRPGQQERRLRLLEVLRQGLHPAVQLLSRQHPAGDQDRAR